MWDILFSSLCGYIWFHCVILLTIMQMESCVIYPVAHKASILITPFVIKAYHTTYILLIKLVVKKLRAMHGMHLMMIRQLRISSDNGWLLACKICLATWVQLNDCPLCLKGETAVHLFMPPLHDCTHFSHVLDFVLLMAYGLDIHSASNPSCMLHTQLKSNQTKIVSCFLESALARNSLSRKRKFKVHDKAAVIQW